MTDNLHPVRVTQEPGVVREVGNAELLDLARQGLIHSYEHTPEAAAVLEGTNFETVGNWPAAEKLAKLKKTGVVKAPAQIGATAPAADETKGE